MSTAYLTLHDLNPLLPFIAPSVPEYWEIVLQRTKVILRREWGAMKPRRRDFLDLPIFNIVFVFNTDAEPCETHLECMRSMRDLQKQEFKKIGNPDIKQNFLIGGDGYIYEGRGWKYRGMCPEKYFTMDNKCLSIGFMGDYRNIDPGFLMWSAAFKLIALGIDTNFIGRHFDVAVCRT